MAIRSTRLRDSTSAETRAAQISQSCQGRYISPPGFCILGQVFLALTSAPQVVRDRFEEPGNNTNRVHDTARSLGSVPVSTRTRHPSKEKGETLMAKIHVLRPEIKTWLDDENRRSPGNPRKKDIESHVQTYIWACVKNKVAALTNGQRTSLSVKRTLILLLIFGGLSEKMWTLTLDFINNQDNTDKHVQFEKTPDGEDAGDGPDIEAEEEDEPPFDNRNIQRKCKNYIRKPKYILMRGAEHRFGDNHKPMPGNRNRRRGPANATAHAGDSKVDTDKDNDLLTPLTTNITTEDITNVSNLASSSSHPQPSSLTSNAPAGSSATTRRRGTRPGMKSNSGGGRMDKDGGTAGGTGSDLDSEVEMPRRETFGTSNSNNFVNQSQFTASRVKEVRGAMDVLDLQDPLSSPSPRKATSATTGNTELQALQDYFGDASPLPIRVTRDEPAQDKEREQQEQQDDVDDMISRLSLSPPPSPDMFELLDDEDYIDGGSKSGTGFAPWLMHFDSEETTPAFKLRTVLDLRVSDLETSHRQSSVGATSPANDFGGQDMEMDEDKEGDDPFGFFKAERKLSRRWSSRPSHRLSAINERAYRPDAVMNNRRLLRSPLRNLRVDNNNGAAAASGTSSSGSESLEKVVMERAAARRRGGAGQSSSGKGKAAVRGLDSDEQVDTINNLVAEPTAAEAADIEKAIRLSLNDLAGFEKTGDSSSSASASGTARPEPADVAVAAVGSLFSVEDVASPKDKEVVRSNRRISRMYGRSQPVAKPAAEEIPSATAEATATTTTSTAAATTSGARNDILELDNLFSSPPSTPPRKPTANRPLSDNFRHSVDLDDFSPIVLEATPTKKPEAGMPSTFESAQAGQRTRIRPKKFMATELLAAMLPRPRKSLARTVAVPRSSRRSKGGDNVFEVESDVSADDEEEEEVLVRRRTASAAKAATTTTATGKKLANTSTKTAKAGTSNATKATANISSQKRHAPASTTTAAPASKRPRPQKSLPAASAAAVAAASSSGSKSRKAVVVEKEEEDRSHWTKQQRAAHEERIRYFAQIDDFELEVETC
ncbi:hypothetical protein BGX30_011731 [Mortierella sp. GBA39]|nr:hypothetical protein BGX30_011731 [Mortierella sp. GBA39]